MVFGGPTRLEFTIYCGNGSFTIYCGDGSPVALPTFGATLTFRWTVLGPAPTTTFN